MKKKYQRMTIELRMQVKQLKLLWCTLTLGNRQGRHTNCPTKWQESLGTEFMILAPLPLEMLLEILCTLQNMATRLNYPFRESTQIYIPINLHMLINKEKPEIASNAHFYFFSVADAVNVLYIAYGTVS